MKKLILYDLDGTLVDTKEDIARAANFMLGELGQAQLTGQEIERFVGKGLYHLIESCLKTDDPSLVERGAKLYRNHYTKHMLDHSHLYPGAEETLRYFHDRYQAVLTNKPNPFSEQMLDALGVRTYFFKVIAGNSGLARKPNPESIHALMKEKQVLSHEVLLIGDSLIDIETGKNAGVTVAVLSHGFSPTDELESGNPDHLMGGFNELLEYARTNSW